MLNLFQYLRIFSRIPTWQRYVGATAVVLLGLGLLLLVMPRLDAGYPFIVFFPAVVLCALLFEHLTGV
jgi:hypothetical protein